MSNQALKTAIGTHEQITTEDISVRYKATLSVNITVGLYAGPVTHSMIIDRISDLLEIPPGTVDGILDCYTIEAVVTDDNQTLAKTLEPR